MKLIFALVMLALTASGALAQRAGLPRFQTYNVPVFKGRSAPMNLNAGEARRYRTVLRDGARAGVNFGGHYTLVFWGCGTQCMDVGIIDVKSGQVYFPPQLDGFGVEFWDGNEEALRFKPNSRLLIASGYLGRTMERADPTGGLLYYEWTGRALKLVKFIEKKRDP